MKVIKKLSSVFSLYTGDYVKKYKKPTDLHLSNTENIPHVVMLKQYNTTRKREGSVLGLEELNDLYSSPNIVRVIKSRRMRWVGHVARMGEEKGVYRVLVGKPEGKIPLGRPRCRWVDNIRTDLQEVGCGYVDWIGLAQDRDSWRTLVSAVMNLGVP